MSENYHNTYIVNLIDSGDHKLILAAFLFNNKDITERALNNWLTKFTTAQQFRDLLSALNNLENEFVENGKTKSGIEYSRLYKIKIDNILTKKGTLRVNYKSKLSLGDIRETIIRRIQEVRDKTAQEFVFLQNLEKFNSSINSQKRLEYIEKIYEMYNVLDSSVNNFINELKQQLSTQISTEEKKNIIVSVIGNPQNYSAYVYGTILDAMIPFIESLNIQILSEIIKTIQLTNTTLSSEIIDSNETVSIAAALDVDDVDDIDDVDDDDADDDNDDEDSIISSAKALLNSTYDIIIQIYKNNSNIVINPENLIRKFGASRQMSLRSSFGKRSNRRSYKLRRKCITRRRTSRGAVVSLKKRTHKRSIKKKI